MKTKLSVAVALVLGLSSSAFAVEQAAVKLPDTLTCEPILCVFGGEQCGWEVGTKPFTIAEINSNPGPLLKGITLNGDRGRIFQNNTDDLVTLDFSDGDQLAEYVFKKEEVALLANDTAPSIRGLFRMGCDWMDGNHVDIMTVVQCSAIWNDGTPNGQE